MMTVKKTGEEECDEKTRTRLRKKRERWKKCSAHQIGCGNL
jgi:hypothetical protein